MNLTPDRRGSEVLSISELDATDGEEFTLAEVLQAIAESDFALRRAQNGHPFLLNVVMDGDPPGRPHGALIDLLRKARAQLPLAAASWNEEPQYQCHVDSVLALIADIDATLAAASS